MKQFLKKHKEIIKSIKNISLNIATALVIISMFYIGLTLKTK